MTERRPRDARERALNTAGARRYRARKRGEEVPLRRSGPPPLTDIRHKECEQCGGPIPKPGDPYRKPSYIARIRWCSRACAKAAVSAALNTAITCERCGRDFPVRGPASAARRRFCSVVCANTAIAEARIVRPLRGIEANRGRRAARLAMPNICAICDWPDVDACHIIPVRDGGSYDLDNFVLLCPNHHRMLDNGRLPAEEARAARDRILRSA